MSSKKLKLGDFLVPVYRGGGNIPLHLDEESTLFRVPDRRRLREEAPETAEELLEVIDQVRVKIAETGEKLLELQPGRVVNLDALREAHGVYRVDDRLRDRASHAKHQALADEVERRFGTLMNKLFLPEPTTDEVKKKLAFLEAMETCGPRPPKSPEVAPHLHLDLELFLAEQFRSGDNLISWSRSGVRVQRPAHLKGPQFAFEIQKIMKETGIQEEYIDSQFQRYVAAPAVMRAIMDQVIDHLIQHLKRQGPITANEQSRNLRILRREIQKPETDMHMELTHEVNGSHSPQWDFIVLPPAA